MAEPRRKNLFSFKTLLIVAMLFLGVEFYVDRFQIFDVSLPALESSGSNEFADRQDYKDILQLQKAFIRNAKNIKPTVVSINKILDGYTDPRSARISLDEGAHSPLFGARITQGVNPEVIAARSAARARRPCS